MISIITPFCNAESSLGRCIDSILAQTYTDFELLLVDDGSTDGSLSVCESYASRETRVRVVSQAHGGVCAARNHGLNLSRGEYVSFVDADDWVDSTFLQAFVDGLNGAQLYIQDIFMHPSVDNIDARSADKTKVYSLGLDDSTSDDAADIARSTRLFGACWNALFLSSVVREHSLQFDTKITRGEDTDFIMRYALYINKVRTLPHAAYHYMMPAANKSYATYNMLYGTVKLYENMLRLTQKVNPAERKAILDEEAAEDVDWAMEGLFYYPKTDETGRQQRNELLVKFSKYFYPHLCSSSRTSFRHRAFRLLCLSGNPAYVWWLSRAIMAIQRLYGGSPCR